MSATVNVKVGFVPSYRHRFSDWCKKMRDDSLATLAQVKGLEVVATRSTRKLLAAKGRVLLVDASFRYSARVCGAGPMRAYGIICRGRSL